MWSPNGPTEPSCQLVGSRTHSKPVSQLCCATVNVRFVGSGGKPCEMTASDIGESNGGKRKRRRRGRRFRTSKRTCRGTLPVCRGKSGRAKVHGLAVAALRSGTARGVGVPVCPKGRAPIRRRSFDAGCHCWCFDQQCRCRVGRLIATGWLGPSDALIVGRPFLEDEARR